MTDNCAAEAPGLAELIADLERRRGNARTVRDNDAAGADARGQAENWALLLSLVLAIARGPRGGDLALMLRHWERLLAVVNDEWRAGLLRGPEAGR